MPPRVGLRPWRTTTVKLCPYHQLQLEQTISRQSRFASAATAVATSSAPSIEQPAYSDPSHHYPPTQPPSFKPPHFRKSQLVRQYASLLQSCPLVLFFQHNNLKSNEWMALRREVTLALRQIDAKHGTTQADSIKMQVVQTGLVSAALNLLTFAQPPQPTPSHAPLLSAAAHSTARRALRRGATHGLEPLLSGPLMLVSFPAASPPHLAAALSLLSPRGRFAAPRRRANPGYYDPAVQAAVEKLLLLAARVEGRAVDFEGVEWVAGIEGGLDGLRAELVGLVGGDALKLMLVRMLESTGGDLVGALEGTSRGLWGTLEGRRGMLEGEKENTGSV